MLRMMAKSFVWTCILIALLVWGARFAHASSATLTIHGNWWVNIYSCPNFNVQGMPDFGFVTCNDAEVLTRWRDSEHIFEDGFELWGRWSFVVHPLNGQDEHGTGCAVVTFSFTEATLICP